MICEITWTECEHRCVQCPYDENYLVEHELFFEEYMLDEIFDD